MGKLAVEVSLSVSLESLVGVRRQTPMPNSVYLYMANTALDGIALIVMDLHLVVDTLGKMYLRKTYPLNMAVTTTSM